jgi:hypothetical protein
VGQIYIYVKSLPTNLNHDINKSNLQASNLKLKARQRKREVGGQHKVNVVYSFSYCLYSWGEHQGIFEFTHFELN